MRRTKSQNPRRLRSGNETATTQSRKTEEERSFFCRVQDCFHLVAKHTSLVLGSAWSFSVALLIILLWAFSGPAFHYSDTWQLVINTGTTIVTFLMVFLIQNTQNRDSKAMALKLDELIRALKDARDEMVALEDMPEEKLDELKKEFSRMSKTGADATAES
jgi:low affinity Fe/Cu permease